MMVSQLVSGRWLPLVESHSRWKLLVLVLWTLLPSVLFVRLFVEITTMTTTYPAQNSIDSESKIHSYADLDAPICTFGHIAHSFARTSSTSSTDIDEQMQRPMTSCWHLESEIVEVPVTAIRNREDMPKLGQGLCGGVFMALVELDGEQQPTDTDETTARFCWAALKTDLCGKGKGAWWRRFQARTGKAVPCVVSGTVYEWVSFLHGEITGMLLPYSYWRRNLELPTAGILPTLAVVSDPTRDTPFQNLVRWFFSWIPYQPHNPTHVGVIMPLGKFKSLTDSGEDARNNRSAIGDMMLPVAQALEAYHSLGLVHQDVNEKNVAIDETTGRGMLYDNSLMAQRIPCTSETMCDYCLDDTIGHLVSKFNHDLGFNSLLRGYDAALVDVRDFARMVKHIFLTDDFDAAYRSDLINCRSASELVRLFEKWKEE